MFKCIVFDINKVRNDFKKRANENINKIKPNEAIIIPGIKLEQNVSNNIEDKIPINKIKNIRDD